MGNITVDNQGNAWETTIATISDDYYQVINCLSVYVKKLSINAKIPTRGSEQAAGYDLYADLGDEKACFNLGICYRDGAGVCQDLDEAEKWLLKAKELGHPDASQTLEQMKRLFR